MTLENFHREILAGLWSDPEQRHLEWFAVSAGFGYRENDLQPFAGVEFLY